MILLLFANSWTFSLLLSNTSQSLCGRVMAVGGGIQGLQIGRNVEGYRSIVPENRN